MLHCFTSVQIKLQFMWSSRRCVLVCKLYKFYVSCAMTLLANKNMYLKIDRKVRKEKELQSGNAIWHPMSFSPPVLLAPYPSGWYIISVLLVSFFLWKGSFVPTAKEWLYFSYDPVSGVLEVSPYPYISIILWNVGYNHFVQDLGRKVSSYGMWEAAVTVAGCSHCPRCWRESVEV